MRAEVSVHERVDGIEGVISVRPAISLLIHIPGWSDFLFPMASTSGHTM